LHDSISQTLFSINLGARAIRKIAEKDPIFAMEELIVLEKSAQTAQQEMRSLMNELREPPRSENSGTINLVLVGDHLDLKYAESLRIRAEEIAKRKIQMETSDINSFQIQSVQNSMSKALVLWASDNSGYSTRME
jgi:signal transduction histidine kinase